MSKIRVQLDFRPDEVGSLDALRDRCALRSRADAVRLALGLMEWVAQQTDQGNQIVSIGAQPLAPLTVPGLTHRIPNQRVFDPNS
jgi:hypothetical protein